MNDSLRAAEAAELAIVELCKSSSLISEKGKINMLTALEQIEARDEHMCSIMEDIEKTVEQAAGEAGENVKYLAACRSMKNRWQLFLAIMNISDNHEPEVSDMFKFNAFLYTHRQRLSLEGRQGVGDSLAEMAQYILAQVSNMSVSNRQKASESIPKSD
jgi:hypothetical protein